MESYIVTCPCGCGAQFAVGVTAKVEKNVNVTPIPAVSYTIDQTGAPNYWFDGKLVGTQLSAVKALRDAGVDLPLATLVGLLWTATERSQK